MDIDDLAALLGEGIAAETGADIWVVMPAAHGSAGARLLGEARRLANGLGCYVHALLTREVGAQDAGAKDAIAFGADRVHIAADPLAYLSDQQPEFVLFDDTQRAEAAYFAQRNGAGLITGARGPLRVDETTRALLAAHPVYDGEYFQDRAVTSTIKVVTLVADDLPAPFPDTGRSGEVRVADTAATAPRLRDLGPANHTPPAWRPLSKARLIVSAGRGVRDEAGFALVRQLAEALGAALAGDRSALSSGWIDEAHEVGVTGQEVAPDVYLAVGILGDTVHNAAIAGARRVIAVHAQPQAPIFKVAEVAVVAEPKTWVALLLAALKQSITPL